MSEIAVLFGNKVREIRTSKHMSQEELAYRSNLSPAHLGQIERAQKNPTIDTIAKIAAALETPISDLFLDSPVRDQLPYSTALTDKILIHVNRMSEKQKKEILRLICIVEHFNSIDTDSGE